MEVAVKIETRHAGKIAPATSGAVVLTVLFSSSLETAMNTPGGWRQEACLVLGPYQITKAKS